MTTNDNHQDRTEPATPRRREEALQKGHNQLSQELTMALMLLLVAGAFLLLGPGFVDGLGSSLRDGLGLVRARPFDAQAANHLVLSALSPVTPWLLLLLGGLVAVGLAGSYAQVGVRFTPARIALDPARLDPVRGLRRLFGAAAWFRTGTALLKVVALGAVLFLVLRHHRNDLLNLVSLPLFSSAAVVVRIGFTVLWWTVAVLLVFGLSDLGFQRWRFERDIRMSRKEIEDERRNTEGDPRMRSRIRRAQREISRRRMMVFI
jgi:flagellar biosynthetic protein FlhB